MDINFQLVKFIKVIDTKVIIYFNDNKVLDYQGNIKRLLNDGCKYYDLCSLDNRNKLVKDYFGNNSYKLPIVISISNNIIFVTVKGLDNKDNILINIKYISNYYKSNNKCNVILSDSDNILLNCSYQSFKQMIDKAKILQITFKAKKGIDA